MDSKPRETIFKMSGQTIYVRRVIMRVRYDKRRDSTSRPSHIEGKTNTTELFKLVPRFRCVRKKTKYKPGASVSPAKLFGRVDLPHLGFQIYQLHSSTGLKDFVSEAVLDRNIRAI